VFSRVVLGGGKDTCRLGRLKLSLGSPLGGRLSIDFEPDETESALSDSLRALCRQHCPENLAREVAGVFPRDLWAALSEFGLFALATPDGFGGVVEIEAAGDILGSFVAPGPLAPTFFAVHALPAGEEREAVIAGETVVSLGRPPLMPWFGVASVFLSVRGDRVVKFEEPGEIEQVATLSGEPWSRLMLGPEKDLGSAAHPCALYDVFVAAYLVGAARKLVKEAAEYVANRRQFGKTLSQFQAISHPLAESSIRVRAAGGLARLAAHQVDLGLERAYATAQSARISAENAALKAINVCHQSYGAMGMTEEGPVAYVSRRLRQLVNHEFSDVPRVSSIEQQYNEHMPALLVVAR